MLKRYANYGFNEFFDSSMKNLTYILKWKSVMETHVITKSTHIHIYSIFPRLITSR
jgi:hypothetical protein